MPGRRPPLYDLHDAAGASFTEFGGWEMPVEFDSIRVEHDAVRERAGRFDVSHMGELEIEGPDAMQLTQRVTTNDVSSLEPGDAQYAAITDASGHMIDDTIVYHVPESWAGDYLVIPNAGNDETVQEWFLEHTETWGLEAAVRNRTEDYALFAFQGPEAVDPVDAAAVAGLDDLSRFRVTVTNIEDVRCLVSRTGYTGEDGVEVLCAASDAERVWSAITAQRCGLGARDTLRTEMGFLLSGQDFDRSDNLRTPYEAGIGFVVNLDTEFVGQEPLAEQDRSGVEEEFVGLRLLERGVPRHGYDILDDGGTAIGTVTSGTMSPTLNEPIGLGYLPVEYTDPGTEVAIEIRGNRKAAAVTRPPFLEGY